jgi:hypothetical protein
VTGIIAGAILADYGLFILPNRRRKARDEFREKTDALRERLGEVVRRQFEAELGRSIERMREAIAPYTHFVRSEHARMSSAREDLAVIDAEAGALRAEISAPGVGPTESPCTQPEEAEMTEREKRERKLVALMVNDLGPGFGEKEVVNLQTGVNALSDDELRSTLAARLDLPRSVDEETLQESLLHVDEREEISGNRFTGAPDMSHEPRPEEREG